MRWWAVIVLLSWTPRGALAHALKGTWTIDADSVHVEAFYDTDAAAEGATAKAFDASGSTIAAGVTDAKGRWSFPRPKAGRYTVHIDAGLGHRVTLQLQVLDGPRDSASDQPTREQQTRFPWLGLASGLAIIAALALASRWWLTSTASGGRKPSE